MGGFFIDDIIGAIIRNVRRESRRIQALRWSIAEGTFTRFTTSYGSPTLPLLDYTFQVNGQTHDGSATGVPIKDDRINKIGDLIDFSSYRPGPIRSRQSRQKQDSKLKFPPTKGGIFFLNQADGLKSTSAF